MQKLLTLNQVSERTGLSHWTLRAWIREKRIDYVRIGRSLRIPESVIENLIEGGFRKADRVSR